MHAPHLILRLRVGAERQQILHSFPLACLCSLMQRSLPIALHCLAAGALYQWISNAKLLQQRHAAAGLSDAMRGTALPTWTAICKGELGEKLCKSGAHPVVGAGVDEDLDHINLVLPCCQMEGCGAVLQGSKAALMSALRKRLLWNDLACLQVPVRSC